MRGRDLPTRLVMKVAGLSAPQAYLLAEEATAMAQRMSPKLSGDAASAMQPYANYGEFGIQWSREAAYVWYQESGVGPFTMRALAGKTIPMWIDDPTGKEHQDNPKSPTRVTKSGRRQVLIFRKAARIGQTKQRSYSTPSGGRYTRTVPASYPGAPGRIASRHIRTGQIASHPPARPHVGVRWRFPGLHPRQFMHQSLMTIAKNYGVTGSIAPGYGS